MAVTLSEKLGLADAYELATVLSEEPIPYTTKRVEADRRATLWKLAEWLERLADAHETRGAIEHAQFTRADAAAVRELLAEKGGGDG